MHPPPQIENIFVKLDHFSRCSGSKSAKKSTIQTTHLIPGLLPDLHFWYLLTRPESVSIGLVMALCYSTRFRGDLQVD